MATGLRIYSKLLLTQVARVRTSLTQIDFFRLIFSYLVNHLLFPYIFSGKGLNNMVTGCRYSRDILSLFTPKDIAGHKLLLHTAPRSKPPWDIYKLPYNFDYIPKCCANKARGALELDSCG